MLSGKEGDSAQRLPVAELTIQKVVREGVCQTFPKSCGTTKAARGKRAVARTLLTRFHAHFIHWPALV